MLLKKVEGDVMYFSEYFKVSADIIEEYGAVDISLVCDIPLFIDPMLIFNNDKEEYKYLHEEIIKYFHFLSKKSAEGLSAGEILAWFNFSEVPNNWLGYSLVGNKGNALGKSYANFLYNNIGFALETHGITMSQHVEKTMLLYDKSGKDKISDLTVNLIKFYLADYTETFAKKHISKSFCKRIPVENAYFNYNTESFVSKEYTLPVITNEKGKLEYVLLTPFDILREDEPSINMKDFYNSHERIRKSIDNDAIRAYVSGYILKAVNEYEELQRSKKLPVRENTISQIEKEAFKRVVKECPELYNYYIRLRENDVKEINEQSLFERGQQIARFYDTPRRFINSFHKTGYAYIEGETAIEESIRRIKAYKNYIECNDGYKDLYIDGKCISNEADLQRRFKLIWYGTGYKVDAETNNGRGHADFIISEGQRNQCIIEFKLARNSSLNHVFTQVKIYEEANCTDGSLIVIFYFTESEYHRALNIVTSAGYKEQIDKSVFLIDCRNDNKHSASVA